MTLFLRVLWVVVVIFCGCAKHHEHNTFDSEIKTYTYEEALEASEDSEGFYNFFLLPDISPHQAYTFEKKLAKEWGFGYNVYTGAHPHSVDVLVAADVPIELFAVYIETLVAHIHAGKATKPPTFRAAIANYLTLRKAIQLSTPKISLYFQAEADRVLLYLLLMLSDNDHFDVDYRIHSAYRLLDRVKFHMYKEKVDTSD